MLSVKTRIDNLIQHQQCFVQLPVHQLAGDGKIIIVIEHIQAFDDTAIIQILSCKAHQLVENGECIAQSAVGFLSNNLQRLVFGLHLFAVGYKPKVAGDIIY